MPLRRVRLAHLEIEGFRNLERVRLDLSPGLNLIEGPNASGKTSLLEAVHCLFVGKSFRTAKGKELIQWGRDQATVFGRMQVGGEQHRIGVGKDREGGTEIRMDGRKVESAAEVAQLAPVQVVGTEAYALVAEGPWLRRRFLDWGVFHVEPGYGEEWQRYRRAVRQRNALLRSGKASDAELEYWDGAVAEAGTALTDGRRRYVALLLEEAADRLRDWFGLGLELALSPGWNDQAPLREVLRAQREQDRERGFTGRGPHRADLRIRVDGRGGDALSR
ncbi:MAG TPA: DNA replication and repair protein RecF, partial [Gammaproteobacteria bacterium]|nr:DNA replication and repair protein RecF [Gammaproteobacteria bacterium]